MPTKFFCATCKEFVGYVNCPNQTSPVGPHQLTCGPNLTVDALVEHHGRLILVFRAKRDEPEVRKWALPGGYVNYRERCVDAAVREAREETGLELTSLQLFGVYDDPRRDMHPERNNVSIAYTAVGVGSLRREACPDGEVSAVRGFTQEEIEDGEFSPLPEEALWASRDLDPKAFLSGRFAIAFDHRRILMDYFAGREQLR